MLPINNSSGGYLNILAKGIKESIRRVLFGKLGAYIFWHLIKRNIFISVLFKGITITSDSYTVRHFYKVKNNTKQSCMYCNSVCLI